MFLDPHQTPAEVLALNAAAIIANIKLQTQLSKKKTPNGQTVTDPASSFQDKNGIVSAPLYVYLS